MTRFIFYFRDTSQGWDRIPVDASIVDFYDQHVAEMPNTKDTRDKTTGSNDSKSYKLQSIRKSFFRWNAEKDLRGIVPKPRSANCYDWAKHRYNEKLEFYNDVKVVDYF